MKSSRFTIFKNVNIPISNDNQIRFSSEQQQKDFFSGCSPFPFNNLQYKRTDNAIEVDMKISFEQALFYDYASYTNPSHNNKVYYCFIDNIAYINDEVTRFYLRLDTYQTFMFDMNLGKCYVEREHTQPNTLDEGLNYGTEYDVTYEERFYPYHDGGGRPIYFTLITAIKPLEGGDNVSVNYMSGVPTPLHYYIVPFNYITNTTFIINNMEVDSISSTLAKIGNSEDMVNKVVSINILPIVPLSISISGQQPCNVTMPDVKFVSSGSLGIMKLGYNLAQTLTITTQYKYHGMRAYDGKLMNYPYSFTEIVDYKGNTFIVKNEYINGSNLSIKALSTISTYQKHAFIVNNYNGQNQSLDNGIINRDNNDIPVINDQTAAFMQSARNSITNSTSNSILSSALSGAVGGAGGGGMLGSIIPGLGNAVGAVGGAVLGGVVSGGVTAFQKISQNNAKMEDIKNQPPNVANQGNNVNFDIGNGNIGVVIRKKQIKQEYADILGDYFYRYGYKINQYKIPNISSRSDFNFIKTVDCVVNGSFPQSYKTQIAQMFNNGVTLWHNRKVGT